MVAHGNDATTHMYRLAVECFAAAGHAPCACIELNDDVAIRSLVAAGYGAAMLPLTPAPTRGASACRSCR